MQEEESLVRAAQAGNQDAFRMLVERHRLPVLYTAHILMRDPLLAEDVAQEAWLNAWRALAQFDLHYAFRPWILRIVTNCCRKDLRRWRPTHTTLDDLDEDALPLDADDALAGMLRQEEAAALARAIASLPEAQQRILELRYQADLELGEIATVLDLPLGTVKSRLHRALAMLRHHYTRKRRANPSSNETLLEEIR
jgi:RNA polymerase sigma-70 factor (ECF subfamily)